MSDTQRHATSFSSFCALMARPVLMTGLLRDLLTRHFQPGNIEDRDLRKLIWKDSPDTGILIETVTRWKPNTTEKRPAVVVKRNAYRNIRLGINDQHQMNPADRIGNRHFETVWTGSHTLFCLGGSGAQAEILATEVQRELTQFGPAIRQHLDLKRFAVLDIGAINELEEATENFVVPVTVGYAYSECWVLDEQAPRFNKLSLSAILDA